MALLLAKEGGEPASFRKWRVRGDPCTRAWTSDVEDEVRRLLHEETIVTEFEPSVRALAASLIRTPRGRKIAARIP